MADVVVDDVEVEESMNAVPHDVEIGERKLRQGFLT